MILITGAAGKTGRALLQALNNCGQTIRALVHRPEQVEAVKTAGADEVVVGDMKSQDVLAQAMQGVSTVYTICPNMSPTEAVLGQMVIAAARTAGVERLVYHSVLHPQVEAMPHHWQKLRVEEQLFESGLAYTILQPAAYMQNILASWRQIQEQGVYAVPYAVETRLGMVDLADVVAVAARVLTETGHTGATYELAGSEALTQTEVAAILSRQLNRPVKAETIPLDTWTNQARAANLGDYALETLIKMFGYYENYGFWGNPRVLHGLLDRPPATLADFIQHTVQT